MSRLVALACNAVLAALLAAPAIAQHDERALAADPRTAQEPLAPVLAGLGENHFPVSTKVEAAQAFFDQGLKLTYGFNHQEALRSFKEAARLDPELAMAYWGWALVLGPNINLPMDEVAADQAYEAIQLARARKAGATPKERSLIDALALRYADDPQAERAPLDAAYADAMRSVSHAYPDDLDIKTLYAAALMNLAPWNYWTRDGLPRGRTEEALVALEEVIAIDPKHEGALHYYIHAVEPVDAKRGEPAADALAGLAPGAGHLVHMPSHIWMQVGRYAESYDANAAASKADEGYIAQCRSQGIYPLNYYPHNVHFQAWAAFMQGRKADAIETARKVATRIAEGRYGDTFGLYETFQSMPLFALVRFGEWEQVLAEPKPPAGAHYLTGIWHYARGVAYVHSDKKKKAKEELETLRGLALRAEAPDVLVGFSNAAMLLTIASEVLAGEIFAAAQDWDAAVARLDRAARLEETLLYNEPPDWYYPVRHTLGAVLLEADRAVEAEVVYLQDLRRYPDNGWALFGLAETQRVLGKEDSAAETEKRFERAWKASDVDLASSRY